MEGLCAHAHVCVCVCAGQSSLRQEGGACPFALENATFGSHPVVVRADALNLGWGVVQVQFPSRLISRNQDIDEECLN